MIDKVYNINGKYPNIDFSFTIKGGQIGYVSTQHSHDLTTDVLNDVHGVPLPDAAWATSYELNDFKSTYYTRTFSPVIHEHINLSQYLDTDNGKAIGDVVFVSSDTNKLALTTADFDAINGLGISYTAPTVTTQPIQGFKNVNQVIKKSGVFIETGDSSLPESSMDILNFTFVSNN